MISNVRKIFYLQSYQVLCDENTNYPNIATDNSYTSVTDFFNGLVGKVTISGVDFIYPFEYNIVGGTLAGYIFNSSYNIETPRSSTIDIIRHGIISIATFPDNVILTYDDLINDNCNIYYHICEEEGQNFPRVNKNNTGILLDRTKVIPKEYLVGNIPGILFELKC